MDESIIKSINEGNIHFFITINFKEKIKSKKNLEDKIKKLEETIDKIELISWYNIVAEKKQEPKLSFTFNINNKNINRL